MTCQVPGEDSIRLLGVPADAEGVSIVDDWDPLGMRGTVSRTLLMDKAFVPDELCPLIDGCATRVVWLKVRDSIVEALDSRTLADLLSQSRQRRAPEVAEAGAPQILSFFDFAKSSNAFPSL